MKVDLEQISRMESLVNTNALEQFKASLTQLKQEWIQEGWDEEDIKEYVDFKLYNRQLKGKFTPHEDYLAEIADDYDLDFEVVENLINHKVIIESINYNEVTVRFPGIISLDDKVFRLKNLLSEYITVEN